MSHSAIHVLYGTGSLGKAADRVSDLKAIQAIVDEYKKHGHNTIDTARIYGGGTSEELVNEIGYKEQGLIVDTKVRGWVPGALKYDAVLKSVEESLHALGTKKVHILYLHAPDRDTPIEETLSAIDVVYKQGAFEKFGLSNFSAEEVEKVFEVSKAKGYVLPSVYQGMYNVVARSNEKDLFPTLRKHGVSFYAYSPLAGGFFAEHIAQNGIEHSSGRFNAETPAGQMYRGFYFKESYFTALHKLIKIAHEEKISVQEIALRWLAHHSQLKKKFGDAVILGSTNLDRTKQNLEALDKPALPERVASVLEEIWDSLKDNAPPSSL